MIYTRRPIVWDKAWDEAMGSGEVPPIDNILAHTAVVGDVPPGYTKVAAWDGLPTQIQGNKLSWITFRWGYIFFGTINY